MDGSFYPWVKAFHIIAVIAWMAALLYLPRLYVYHAETPPGSPQSETFKTMERRLLRAIMTPAMIASWLLGLWLALGFGAVDWTGDIWFNLKLVLVLVLTAFHGLLARWRKDFESDRNTRPPGFYRLVNEVPTLAMIGIVVLAVVRPF